MGLLTSYSRFILFSLVVDFLDFLSHIIYIIFNNNQWLAIFTVQKEKGFKASGYDGLRGLDPCSDFMDKPTNPPNNCPFSSGFLAQTKVSLEAVWGGARTRFPHPEEGFYEWSSVKIHKKFTQMHAQRLCKY